MNYKLEKYVHKILLIGLCIGISLFFAISAKADTLSIPGGVGGMPYYGSEYTGAIGANLNGSAISGGITCLDISTNTNVPNPGFSVYVGTLAPVDLSTAKFRNEPNALLKYQQAAWLNGQMAQNPGDTGAISFAIWRLFTDVADTFGTNRNLTLENSWKSQAEHINTQLYDFSSVKIYTATNTTNQEFMSGKASPVPLPAPVWLLGSALLGIFGIRRRITN